MGHGVGRRSRPGYRPWSCGDRAGILPAPAGGVVVAVGCTVFHMRRGGVLWTLQIRVLHVPAVAGHAAVPDPLVGVRACTLGGPGDTWRSRTPRGGRSGTLPVCAERPSLEGHVTSPDPFPSRRWVRTAGVGRIVTGAVPNASRPVSQVSQCCNNTRDGGAVTGVGEWDLGHCHCEEWRPDAVCPRRCGGVVGL